MNRKDFRPNENVSSSSKGYNPVKPKREVVNRFLNGESSHTGNQSLSSNGKELKSYNTTIAVRQSNGTILVNNTKYSSTTSSQQNYLLSELKKNNHKYEVTGGKDRGYQGEDLSDDGFKHYDSYDGTELYEKDNKIYVKEQNGYRFVHYKGKEENKRDYSKEYSGEYTGK